MKTKLLSSVVIGISFSACIFGGNGSSGGSGGGNSGLGPYTAISHTQAMELKTPSWGSYKLSHDTLVYLEAEYKCLKGGTLQSSTDTTLYKLSTPGQLEELGSARVFTGGTSLENSDWKDPWEEDTYYRFTGAKRIQVEKAKCFAAEIPGFSSSAWDKNSLKNTDCSHRSFNLTLGGKVIPATDVFQLYTQNGEVTKIELTTQVNGQSCKFVGVERNPAEFITSSTCQTAWESYQKANPNDLNPKSYWWVQYMAPSVEWSAYKTCLAKAAGVDPALF